jgi:hypothetical protein
MSSMHGDRAWMVRRRGERAAGNLRGDAGARSPREVAACAGSTATAATATGPGYITFEDFLRQWGAPEYGFAEDEVDALWELWQEKFRIVDAPGSPSHAQAHIDPEIGRKQP